MKYAAFSLLLAPMGAALTVSPAAALPHCCQEVGKRKTQEEAREKAQKKALEAAQEARHKLEAALKSKEVSIRTAAVLEAGKTVHPLVIDELEDALGDKDAQVVKVVLDVLGQMEHPAAIKPLTGFLRRKKKALKEDTDLHALALRSLGRRAGKDEVKTLLNGAFEGPLEGGARDVVRARLFGAARTRTRAALEEILAGMRKTSQNHLRPRMDDVRTALIWLTGKDLGESPEAWAAWWRDAEATFKIPDKTPKMNEKRSNAWRGFWGDERRYDRQKKRGDRG